MCSALPNYQEHVMHTVITALHCELPEALGQFASRAVECTVVFSMDHNVSFAEARLHVPKGRLFVAQGEGGDHRSALDRVEEKLRHQLDKTFLKARSRRVDPA
jgi:ribosome-associated translation inhibitor RaiA